MFIISIALYTVMVTQHCYHGGCLVCISKKPQIQRFEYLDGQEWSFCFRHLPHSIQHRKIRQIIDHQCYIVIYFYDPLHPPCIIWWDQLLVSQWKNLKILAKLA
ncbi:hypothetical protein F991_02995 [Acinetobacter sp. CIP-A165]|nr:hypothetical protein F991_02995 [Acinetobacter sp. CIP-A165]